MSLKMEVNKKSLIQIVLLVVLIIIAVGAYLMQQEGGLDFLTSFIESGPVTARAPVTRAQKPAPDQKSPAATDDATAIPATPAKGVVHGKPFSVESSSIENGVLTLRLGKDVNSELEVKLMLLTPSWEVPAGKKFKIANASGTNSPAVVLAWREPGQSVSTEQKFTEKYTLNLELGQEKDNKLPGKISLSLPDAVKSHVAGTFDADIKGFRLVNGKPDLTVDSVDTLQYLSLRELLKDDPNRNLEVVAFRDGRYAQSDSAGNAMTGYLEAEYRSGGGPSAVQRFQFVKDAGAWKVANTLKASQLDEAHPLKGPGSNASPVKWLTYLAARKLEADIQKKFPNKGIYEPEFMTRHSDKFKIGVCESSYKLDPAGEKIKTAYLFRHHASGWTMDRELMKNEKVNFETGRIGKR